MFKNKDLNKIIKKLVIILLFLVICIVFLNVYNQTKDTIFFLINFLFSLFIPILSGFLIAYLMWPFVKKIEKVTKKRFISVLLANVFIFGFILYLIAFFVPQVYHFALWVKDYDYSSLEIINKIQSDSAIRDAINNAKESGVYDSIKKDVNSIQISDILDVLFSSIGKVLSFSASFLFAIVISFYVLARYEKISYKFKYIFSPKKRKNAMDLIYDINAVIRSYFEGLISIGIINASIAFIFYLIVGFSFGNSLNLSMFLFLLYSIPYIGMVLAGIPAVILAIQQSLIMAIIVIVFLIILTNVSANIIEPKIYGSKIGLDPLVVLIGIIIVSSLFGLIGLIIAMPLIAIASVLFKKIGETYKDWFDDKKEKKEKNENK